MDSTNTTDRSVTGIIAAFRNSLQEFKNYRERKRKAKNNTEHKGTKRIKSKADASGDELLLSNSLRKGAIDVEREYDCHYRKYGDSYALGDAMAQSSLSRTLRKLNACFNKIITALLQKDAQIDYKYLTSVSDVSRREALESLSQLSVRLSMAAYPLQHEKEAARHRRQKSSNNRSKKSLSSCSDKTGSSVSKKGYPTVKKVQLKSASSPQLAIVRPKAKRSNSSKSDVTAKTDTTATLIDIPVLPELPAYPPKHTRKDSGISISPPPRSPPVEQPMRWSPPPATLRRRLDKMTPSMHTTSTHLGEIPELKWSLPYDREEMSRLNREHGGRPWPPPPEPTRPKRGFLSLFKKSEFKTAEVAA